MFCDMIYRAPHSRLKARAPSDRPQIGAIEIVLGIAVTFLSLVGLSLISSTAAAYTGAVLLSLILARLIYSWLHP